MKLNKFTRILCLAIVSVLIMASSAMAVNVNNFVDFPNDWSTPAMEYAVENGLIKGYEDNTIRADKNITRAEMGAIVNRAFGSFVEATKFPYLDVEDVAWFYKDMKKAVNMGTMQGSNNLLRPDDAITREEAFIVIARAYSQKNTETSVLEQYEDYENISNWAKEYLSFLTENDYVNGFDDGNLYPKSNLTRAELSQVLYNMISEYVASQEELDTKNEYDGNIIINGKIANVTGKTFKGDLVIGDGVGVEKIVIKDTKIEGCLTVRGTTQIKLVNTTVGNRIIVNNPNNNVHFDNYKTEKVFNNVEVQTSATWKTPASGGGGIRYFTVSFMDENGYIHSSIVAQGTTVSKPTDPTRTGYTFGGWYSDENCTVPYDFSKPVNGNLIIYAKWTPNKYTITFNYNGGTSGITEKEVTYDSTYGVLPETGKEGYIFEGWYIGNDKIVADTQVKITSDTEIKAKWTAKTYTLSFDSKGGNAVADKTVTYDSAIGMLTIPVKTGYTFKGWTIDGDLINLTTVYKFATNKVAEANWEANKYTLTFQGLTDEIEVTYDGKYPTLPAGPTQAGKTFVGWFDGSTQIKEGNPVKITENTHLVPKYTDKPVYVVTFDANGGSGTSTQNIIEGETAQLPAEPTREGYSFKGWYNEAAGLTEFDFSTPITGIKTVYAKWEIKTYTVVFKDWNGNVLDTQTVNYNGTAVYSGITPSRAADNTYTYTFDGWDQALTNIKSDITVNAKYISTFIEYTVKFVAEGITVETFIKHYGDIIEVAKFPAIPVKTGHDAVWSITTDIIVNSSIEVSAVYTPAKFTLTFEGLTNTIEVTYGDVYPTLPTPAIPDGQNFVGWFDGSIQIKEGNRVEITKDTELVPVFTNKAVYTVTFNANGGTPNSTQSVVDGNKVVKPTDPTRDGYTFKGWFKDEAATQKFDLNTEITGDIQLYAGWAVDSYTITFKNWDGSILETKELPYGTTATYTGATPEKVADVQYTYTFSGWSPALGTVTGEAEYVAQFTSTVNQYTYKFFDEDGTTVLKEATVDYGTTIVAPANPTKVADAQYTYTFKEWEGYTAGMTVTGNVTFKAVYEKTVNQYTYKFFDEDGTTVLKEATVDYGTTIVAPANPTKTADAQYTYTFKEWEGYTAGMTVTGNVTFKAVYEKAVNQYTYKFFDEDGTTVLKEATVDYGTTIVAPANPTKVADAQYTYTFKEWEGYTAGMTVTGNVTFKAVYEKTVNQYTYTFYDEDGTTILKETTVDYGTTIVAPANPTKTADAQYTYTFKEWEGYTAGMTVAGNVTFKAIYEKSLNSYEITFKNWDGSVLETKEIPYGTTATYTGATPEKVADVQYTYTFSGWSPALGTVTGKAEYVAQFTSTVNKYEVKWVNEDGTVLETDTVEYGTVPTYDGATPTKASTAEFSYTFKEWTPAIVAVTGASTYTATYTATVNTYEITFKNWDGSVLETKELPYGTTATYTGATPEKVADVQYTYTFSGWSPALGTVTGKAEYVAQFTSTVNKYEVKWVNEDGTVLETDTVEYGTVPTYDGATPTKASTAEFSYTFKEWTPAVVAVTGASTYTATYTATVNTYEITFKSWDGSVLETKELPYGTTATYTGATPEKPADVQYTYTFSGWTPALGTVTGEAEYVAQFTSTVNQYTYKFFDEDEATVLKEATVDYGTTIVAPANPTKTGEEGYTYTFKEWVGYTAGMTITGNVTFKAVFDKIANEYVVKYDGNGAYGFTTESYHTYDVEEYLTTNGFVKAGNTFLGWSKDKNATVATYEDGELVKNLTTSGEITLYAVWQPNTYYVTYDANSGTGTMSDSTHKYGISSNLAKNEFTKTGYTFIGWATLSTATAPEFTDEGEVLTIAGPVDGARITLYAVWKENTYTVKFNGNGNTSGSTSDMKVKYEEITNLTKNGFVKTGYNFDGWAETADGAVKYADEEQITKLTAEPDGIIEIYAVWSPIRYKVIYNDDFAGSTNPSYEQEFVYGQEGSLIPNRHEQAGYHVVGWEDENGNTYEDEEQLKGPLTTVDGAEVNFYTIWQNNNYYVAYDGNGATSGDMDNSEHLYDIPKKLDLNEYKKTGYDKFLGWNLVPEQSTFSRRSRLMMASAEPDFEDGEVVLNLTEILGDVVDIVAVWHPNKYYVAYNKNNSAATGSMSKSEHYYDTASDLAGNGFALTGYTFAGWATEEDGEVLYGNKENVLNLTTVNEGTYNLYAKWTENSYTVKFNGNGATEGSMTDMSLSYSQEKALNENKFEKTGYTFKGWSTSKNATTATYEDKAKVSMLTAENNGVVTLYAVWEAKTFKLTFDVNGGKELTLTPELEALGYYLDNGKVTVDVTYDKVYPKLPVPEYADESMYFAGWLLDGSRVGSTVKITEDAKLVADWTDEYVHSVVFNKYNEDGTAYITTVINKTAIEEPEEPVKKGYTFDYWSLDEENGTAYDFATIIEATSVQTINLYPYWSANTYTVKYDGNGATEGVMSDSTHKYDTSEKLNANTYKKTGYTFMGWDTDPAGETVVYEDAEAVLNLTDKADGVVTLYAVWAEKAYKVIYDGNGATDGEMSHSMHYYDIEKALNINAFEKEGYDFIGWATDKNMAEAEFADGEIVKNLTTGEEITLYAIWKEKTFKLTFDVNGGEKLDISELGADYYVDTETGEITVDVKYNGQYPVLPVAKYPENAMAFGGWALNGNIIADGDTVTITEDAKLVAVWTDKHIVVFHGYYNDNSGSMNVYVEDGEAVARPTDPVHSSFTFSGWYTNEECTDGNEYDFATIINKVNDEYQTIHLYPRWLITVRFYYGPEAVESEKQAEITVQYNNVIAEEDIPADRVAYGYWKDASVSDVYIGEEYEHNIEFKWHRAEGDGFVVFDLTQPITKSLDLFNVAKVVDINISSSFDAIDGANINAVYTDDEPLYENILDVIFSNENLANSVYEKIEQKEKVFNKLESLGIIDENKNILNQAKFLKFALIGEERLETFIYENVEKELAVDAKESISSYINHLIEKNDGSAEKFLKELIDSLLKGEGKEEMKGVLADMLTEMVDIEKDEFIKYVNKYIDDSIEAGNTQKVENLIHPQIEKLLTEAIAKDFVREMTKQQLTNFVNIYTDALTEAELKAEVKEYIEGLDEAEIQAEVVEYVNSLSELEIKDEITTYINSLSDAQLKDEITTFVDGMNDEELSDAIVEYINTLTTDDLKAEIKAYIGGLGLTEQKEKVREYFDDLNADEIKAELKTYISDLDEDSLKSEIKDYINDLDETGKKNEVEKYIDGLDDSEKVQEVTSYVQDMGDDQFKTEIKDYISGLGNDEFKVELKKYLEENDDEYENLIREHFGLASDEVITDQDKIDHLDDVVDYVMTEPGKKDEITEKAAEYIKTSKRAEYEAEIVNQVTANFANYKADIVDKAMTGDLNSYIDKAVAKIVVGGNLNDYINDVVEDITADTNTTASYINKTVEYIASDAVRLDSYIDKAIGIIVTDDVKKNNYIEDTAYSIATGADKDSYAAKAVNTIVNDPSLKTKYTQKAIDEIVSGNDKADYVTKAVQNILTSADRDSYIDKTIDKIFADGEEQTYIDKVVTKIVNNTPADYSEIDGYIEKMFATPEKKAKVVNYINEQFIDNHDFREAILPDAIDMIFADTASKNEVVSTIVDFIINDEEALAEVTEIAIEDLVDDAEFREHTIDRIAHYLDDHPEIMEEVVEFAKESELGVFVDKFIDELMTKNQFEVNSDNLFVAEAIERAVSKYDYDSFMNEYVPDRFAGLIPDSILKPIYENALGGFKAQLVNAIAVAKEGGVAYVDSGVTVKFNPIADIIVPVFDKYLEFKDKAEDKLDSNNGTVGDIYDNTYGENKYLKELVNMIAIESLLDGDKSLATEELSGYSLKEFIDYYEIIRNATVLLTDTGRWYIEKLPKDKAEAAQEKVAQKITEYFNSVLALVNTYAETEELPSYKDVLEIFEGDIPDRFFAKYESALGKVEAKVDIDDKLDTVYNKLAEKGIVSKFNTVLDKFIASKFNREITEEQIPLVYTIVRRALGYDDFYTVDTVFNVMNEYLTRFKVNEDKFEIGNNKLKITIERSYK